MSSPPSPTSNSKIQQIPTIQEIQISQNQQFTQLSERINSVFSIMEQLSNQLNILQLQEEQKSFIPNNNNRPIVTNNTNSQNQHPTPHPNTIVNSPPNHHNISTNSPQSQMYQNSQNSQNNKIYNGLVKLSPPPSFEGKLGTTAIQVLSFITSVERYLNAVKISKDTDDSLTITIQLLRGNALLWFENLDRREPMLMKNWNDLRVQLLRRYQPIAQEQLSLGKLLTIRYKNSIQAYTDEFTSHLQLLPAYNDPANETLLMGIYLNGITTVSGTAYICTVLKSAIHERKVTTLTELQSIALLAESNLGSSRSNVPSVPSFTSNRYSSSSRNSSYSRSNSGKFNNNQHKQSFKPAFSGSAYQTPARVHNVETVIDPYEEMVNENQHACNDAECTDELEPDSIIIHDDIEPEITLEDEHELMLNNIKFYEKQKSIIPSLTPEKLAERRRNGTCFRCNRAGHFSDVCPLNKTNPQKKQ